MSLVVIEPPQPIVSLDEAKRQLRIDGDDENELITDLIANASAEIEPPDSWIGRAFGEQTLEMRLPEFPCGDIIIRCPPFRQLVSVSYVDPAGVEQTLAADAYRLFAGGTDVARLAPAYGASWPTTRQNEQVVRIRFEAGYEPTSLQLLPAKQGVLLITGFLFENREASPADALAGTADRLLQRYRVWI